MTLPKDAYLEKESHWRISKEEWKTSFHILKTGIDSTQNGKKYSDKERWVQYSAHH
jgi:hypothetical protein